MSLRQYWRDVKHRFKHYMFEDFPAEGVEAAEQYAKAAYTCCVAWYGPPLDPRKPYSIKQTPGGDSFCMLVSGKYHLTISKDAITPEHLCSDIAHEMYHRVAAGRKGLADEMWVQEMMACLTSHWFLPKQGFQDYAEAAREQWLESMGKADVGAIRAYRRQKARDWVIQGGSIYPEGFGDSVRRAGYALISLLDENALCRIINATTLEEWIASLPQEKQYGVCRVLEVEADGKAVPSSEEGLDELCDALEAKGNSIDLIAEFERIVHSQPLSGAAFFYLGYANDVAKENDAAFKAYKQAEGLGYADKWLFHNIGDLYWQSNDYAAAAEWFQKAVDQTPTWARPCYSLGRSLNALDNVPAARQAWEKVLTLGDEKYAKLAQKALEENPLPADVTQE